MMVPSSLRSSRRSDSSPALPSSVPAGVERASMRERMVAPSSVSAGVERSSHRLASSPVLVRSLAPSSDRVLGSAR